MNQETIGLNLSLPPMEEVNRVYMTQGHDVFRHIEGNRNISKANFQKLLKSISEKDLKIPLIVNEKAEIIDGQHRALVYKTLKKPVHFIVCEGYGLADVHRINSISRTWTGDDFMNGYANMGNDNYLIYKKFKKQYKFGHHECQKLLDGFVENNIRTSELFRMGQLKITEDQYQSGCLKADMIYQVKPHYAGFKRRNFVYALLILFKNPEYDHSVFISRLSKQTEILTDQARTDQYISLIEKVYNHRSRNKVRLY